MLRGRYQIFRAASAGILSVLCILMFARAVPAEICNRIVAIVNDDVITLYELNKKMRELLGMDPRVLKEKNNNQYFKVRNQVLDLLINEKIAQKKIEELGIKVSEKEVEDAVEKIKYDNKFTQEDLIATLKAQGMTLESYKEKVKRDLERLRLIQYEVKSKIIIKEEDLKKYYNEHIDQFRTEKKMRLAMIFLRQKHPGDERELQDLMLKAMEIIGMIKKGEDFGKLAKTFSSGPGASEGGDIGEFNPEDLDPVIRKAIKDVPEGGVTRPIIRPNGIQIIKVISKYKKGVKPFEEVKDAIYAILYRQEVDKRYTEWINDLRAKAYTKIIF